jgi:hypothetical protein
MLVVMLAVTALVQANGNQFIVNRQYEPHKTTHVLSSLCLVPVICPSPKEQKYLEGHQTIVGMLMSSLWLGPGALPLSQRSKLPIKSQLGQNEEMSPTLTGRLLRPIPTVLHTILS